MAEKSGLHPRNLHQERYDLKKLSEAFPELSDFVFTNEYGNETLDFSNPKAVISLNKALLLAFYQIEFWEIPDGFLCPPVPGRADYIHYSADLLAEKNKGKVPTGNKVEILDIGTGANLIYPILGSSIYKWNFTGAEMDLVSIQNAQNILSKNSRLSQNLELRKQSNPNHIFEGIIQSDDFFDLTVCNPPFHESEAEAQKGTQRKLKNLNLKKSELNFGGQSGELWCEGGERQFLSNMIQESQKFNHQVFWFTSLLSKESNLKPLKSLLNKAGIVESKVISMSQGNKKSRLLAWTYLSPKQQENWRKFRWA
ncbi:23S rRNA (adenine(1618)-N(6))-methyltransferase RlmF [Algoriphagus zhangzhouensis]|uniref:Ribosomal RNA large subunit methyltransferase F n=1 Tax=Algoriphagus zhangzhouensis TaxID=1073327 RepID=A0A1M7ZAG0_9BACT|nr:23S rRNA (adenine(1618)-N(6))-methyltransferase RlmF [Algoriphagus zhangzhouensis]TDY47134.1 23S rRNA m(6)A-1618 methyltransferase [Algoriphagus zhangzhouensis]SHO61907.1 23S rRNA m(6)A-1618 methyltransferase [Algoriphagus zhangzhouensis]